MSLKNLGKLGNLYNMFALVIIVTIAGGFYLIYGGTSLSIATGSASNYEGVKPSFYGVYYEGFAYEGSSFRGTQMDFDADDPRTGLPDLEGEMTTIFLPKDVSSNDVPNWVPESRALNLEYMSGKPVKVYQWTVDKIAYQMEEYDLKWFVSMEAGYDTFGIFDEEGNNQRWHNAEIWVKMDTNPSWIFEGADKTYFTVGKILVDYVEVEGHNTDKIDVSPESAGTAVSFFYAPYGEPIDLDEEDFRGFAIGETYLNPQVFRNELYVPLRLDDFGSQAWFEDLSRKYQGDIVTWEFTVKVFVFGEWELKDEQDITDLTEGGYGRRVKTTTTGADIKWEEILTTENKFIALIFILIITAGVVIIAYGLAQGYGAGLAMRAGGGV